MRIVNGNTLLTAQSMAHRPAPLPVREVAEPAITRAQEPEPRTPDVSRARGRLVDIVVLDGTAPLARKSLPLPFYCVPVGRPL